MATYKPVMRPALEYASSVWSPIASSTSISKLQVMQNAALKTATGCTQDKHIQHLHDKTLTLPIHEHLQLHASQYKQKTQQQSHPIHKHTTYFNTPRLKKTIFNNGRYAKNIPTDPHTGTTTDIKTNMRHIHTSIVSKHLATRGNNKILRTPPPHTSSSEERLPRITRRTLAQHRTNKSPFLKLYLHKVNAKTHPSPLCPLCNIHTHHTHQLFNCTHIVTHGFVDRPRRSDCTAGQIDGEAGWWTTSGNIGLHHYQGSWEWVDNNNSNGVLLSSVCRKTYDFSSSSLLFSGNIPHFVISNTLLIGWSRLVINTILLEVTGVVSSFSKNNTVSPGIGTPSLGVSLRGSLLKQSASGIHFQVCSL